LSPCCASIFVFAVLGLVPGGPKNLRLPPSQHSFFDVLRTESLVLFPFRTDVGCTCSPPNIVHARTTLVVNRNYFRGVLYPRVGWFRKRLLKNFTGVQDADEGESSQ
jgi:hypothetical protein